MMLSSLCINWLFLSLTILPVQIQVAGLRGSRIIPWKRDVDSTLDPSTTPSLKDTANSIIRDAESFSALPAEISNFIVSVEQILANLDTEPQRCPAPPPPGYSTVSFSPVPSVPLSPIPSTISSPSTRTSPHYSDTILSTSSSTYPSRITLTTTVAITTTTTYASSSDSYKSTTATPSSVIPIPSSGISSSPISSQSPPTSSLPSPSLPSPSSNSSSGYHFNASAADNVAVYYGQTSSTAAGGLLTLCQDPSVDIIILAFVYTFFGPNNYPSASFGPGCSGSTTSQAQSAPGLPSCPQLATEITQCQTIGKPVLLSLGGYIATTAFSSSAQATQFANTIWDLFGGGGNSSSSSSSSSSTNSDSTALRPFGSVVVDGFDIDNEDHSTAYYDDFSTALHSLIASDRSKKYYVSAAPQCPRPDASIPLELMQAADFVWVQFYNNPQCNLGSSGFLDSFQAWSRDLAANASSASSGPRLYIGGGAWSGAGSGYVEGSQLAGIVQGVNGSHVGNFGGMMFWDGTEGLANQDAGGKDYLDYAKEALG